MCLKKLLFFLLLLTVVPVSRLCAQHTALLRYMDSISTTDYDRTQVLCDSLLQQPHSPKEKGILYRLRGRALYFGGNYDAAAQDYAKSVEALSPEALMQERGITFLEQARLNRKIKMYDEAIAIYRRAENLFEAQNDSANLATAWNEWGVVYELQEDYRKAIELYQKSLAFREKTNDTLGIAYAHSFIATSEMGRRNFRQAERHSRYAMKLFEQHGDPFHIAVHSVDLGSLYQDLKNFSQAVFFYKKCDSLAALWDYKDLRAETFKRLAALYKMQGVYDSAFVYQEKYGLLRDSLFTDKSQKTIAELNARYALAEKDAALQKQEKEKDRSTFAALLTGLLLLFVGVMSFWGIRQQRHRNRALVKEHFYKEELARRESENRLAEQRAHISRELHDNIGSYLTFISSSIDRIESQRLRTNDKVRVVKELTQETIIELRKTVWLLNRPALTAFDWQAKLQEYYRHFGEVKVRVTPAAESIQMTSEQATHLFRIVQEAINNALKYSGASQIRVSVDFTGHHLQITVMDNGSGFDPATTPSGFGRLTMQQRTEALGGHFLLESAPGKGTCVHLRLPFAENTLNPDKEMF